MMNLKPAEAIWIPMNEGVPRSGQTVQARDRYTDKIHVVTFQAYPTRRWDEKSITYQFERFAYWRPLP